MACFKKNGLLQEKMDRPVIGERSDAVLRTAMPGDDDF